ncbi:MAG: hypothetical protein AB7G10_06215 [Reyranellaceae bacterium]
MTAAQVHGFFKDYAEAFSAGSIDRIEAAWSFPAFMCFGGRQSALDRDAFHANAVKLCAFYVAQGVVRAEKEVLELNRLTGTTASVRTADILRAVDGSIVAAWEHVYLLVETADGVRIAAALPDNEIRAWAERGTPLGG